MTSENGAQESLTDGLTTQIWEVLLIVKANFPRGTTNQKHHPGLVGTP